MVEDLVGPLKVISEEETEHGTVWQINGNMKLKEWVWDQDCMLALVYDKGLADLFTKAPGMQEKIDALTEALEYCLPRVNRHLATEEGLAKARAALGT
jgi:hypothetical protein